jgi:hypothetical protein
VAFKEPETGDIEIPREQWSSFLENFSRQHEAWLTSIFVAPRTGEATTMDECRLEWISTSDDGKLDIVLDCEGEELKHTVSNPARVAFKRDQQGTQKGLEITTQDDTVVALRFRAPAKP